MAKRGKKIGLNDPLLHPDHRRPKTRREFIAQGFKAGTGTVLSTSLLSVISDTALALPPDLEAAATAAGCDIGGGGNRIPFMSFDLAGGANIAGSNVLVGQQDQMDFLSTDGYRKQGLRADEVPDVSIAGTMVNEELGLRFHANSSMLEGIFDVLSPEARLNVDGIVIPARSQNDTGNNEHNPMYAIYAAGARGTQVDLIGSRNSDSGANSMAPANFMAFVGADVRPAKVDNENDVLGFQEVGKLATLFPGQADRGHVMRAIYRMSDEKLSAVGLDTGLSGIATANGASNLDNDIKNQLRCAYIKAASLAENADPSYANPITEQDIIDIFTPVGGVTSDREFRKTASVMKMLLDGENKAGAGTVTMGGYDYHTGDRTTGDGRDVRAGRCIGAALEYAHRKGSRVCIYVYSDGSVFSNGNIDPNNGRLVWTGDNQQTAASFMLVYNPGGRAGIVRDQTKRQIGSMTAGGDVNTGSSLVANDVRALVQSVLFNYLGLHGDEGNFEGILTHPDSAMLTIPSALGSPIDTSIMDQYLLLGQIT